mgnify:CR=1 FL=1
MPGQRKPLPGEETPSEGTVVEPDLHLARGIRTEGGVHLLYLSAALQEGLDATRVVAIDTLLPFEATKRRTLMTTPATSAAARGLFASVELEEVIPPEHFTAVAKIIGYVLMLAGKGPKS